jgi:rhamnose utilization protein RhaD (predicted bifunctional aldolase and dehydrogenase)
MTAANKTKQPITSLWDDSVAAAMSEPERLLYRSNLLGSDLRITNFGGGNTSAKVAYLPHCTFNLNPRAASIDTPLHAYIARKHVDHMHPDSVIAIAACKNSETLTAKIFEGELGWLPWQRPGYDLGLKLEALSQAQPDLKGIILEGHGLFTWGDTAKSCYETTLAIIQRAESWLEANGSRRSAAPNSPHCRPPNAPRWRPA